MCAAQRLSHVQRDTTSDGMLAFGHSRSGSSRSPCRAHASGVEIGRNDWAAPEPVTGWIRFVSSVVNPVALRLKELETLERVAERIDKISVFGGLDQVLNGLVKLR